jgi:hypothetical protein
MNRTIRTAQVLWICAYSVITILAGGVVWIVGHRGLFLFDQSVLFDGAWRLMQGQVIYRDFFTTFGPVAFVIQWLFFRIWGVDFSAMVLSAAILNSLAAVCVMRIIRRLLPDPQFRLAAIAGGILTGFWFQAPFGTLWFEQTSFFFNLIALTLLVETAYSSERVSVCLRVIAGSSLALSILSKQNAGAVLLPVPLGTAVILCLRDGRKMARALLEVFAGMLAVFTLFVAWLVLFSSPVGFWHSLVVMSREIAADRLPRLISFTNIFLMERTWPFGRKALGLVFIFATSRVAFRSWLRVINVDALVVSWIILGYVFFLNIFAGMTLNEIENSLSYLGLLNGLAFGLCFPAMWRTKFAAQSGITYLLTVPLLVVGTYYLLGTPIFDGWTASASRVVQQFDVHTRFTERVNVPGASRLVWGDPTLVEFDLKTRLSRQDFENVNAWLAKANTNFFVFPDSTMLYGLHRKVSPQPWLLMLPDHSFRLSDLPEVDATVLRSLQKNKVDVVILEKNSFLGSHKILQAMPQLRTWIHDNFEKATEFGIYEIWTQRPEHPHSAVQ